MLLEFDEDQIAAAGNLDGYYAIKTDLVDVHEVDAREVHDRYMELTEVEWAFRTMKTVLLEMRGIFVRKEGRTRAHVFIIMLAYLVAFEPWPPPAAPPVPRRARAFPWRASIHASRGRGLRGR